jgi:hypothetical protein
MLAGSWQLMRHHHVFLFASQQGALLPFLKRHVFASVVPIDPWKSSKDKKSKKGPLCDTCALSQHSYERSRWQGQLQQQIKRRGRACAKGS